jgi:hypothetical protein
MEKLTLEQKSFSLMKFKLRKLAYALKILDKVQLTIDPNAFIAGGFATAYYLDEDPTDNDIDIFFTSPNFEFSAFTSAYQQVNAIFEDELEGAESEVYCYNKRFTKIAELEGEFNVDLIQIKEAPDNRIEYVLDKFDINVCKIALTSVCNDTLYFQFTKDFESGINNETLVVEYNLNEREEENEFQNAITEERGEKYSERFPSFLLEEINV